MSYKITDYSYHRAKILGVRIIRSEDGTHKIDVYDKHFKYITSIGALGYSDFPHYVLSHGIDYALKKREAYKSRHENDRHVANSAGYYADKILW